MYAFSVTESIRATPARVWRALCDPREVVQWDTGVVAARDAPGDYPQPGQHVHWRYRSGLFRTLHDFPQEVVPERKLRAFLILGLFRFDETYTLEAQIGHCQLTAAVEARLPLGVIGWLVERAYLGPRARATVSASLRAIKEHCEKDERIDSLDH